MPFKEYSLTFEDFTLIVEALQCYRKVLNETQHQIPCLKIKQELMSKSWAVTELTTALWDAHHQAKPVVLGAISHETRK